MLVGVLFMQKLEAKLSKGQTHSPAVLHLRSRTTSKVLAEDCKTQVPELFYWTMDTHPAASESHLREPFIPSRFLQRSLNFTTIDCPQDC